MIIYSESVSWFKYEMKIEYTNFPIHTKDLSNITSFLEITVSQRESVLEKIEWYKVL